MRAMVERVEKETKHAVGDIVEMMSGMVEITSEMLSSSDGLARNSEQVASAAEQSLVTLKHTAKVTAELSSSIDLVATQVQSAHSLTIQSVSASRKATNTIQDCRVPLQILPNSLQRYPRSRERRNFWRSTLASKLRAPVNMVADSRS